jgi:hypothetical protein
MAANIQVEAGPQGLTVRIEWTGETSSIPAAIERLRSAGVLELVESTRPAVSHGVQLTKPARSKVEPILPAGRHSLLSCPP